MELSLRNALEYQDGITVLYKRPLKNGRQARKMVMQLNPLRDWYREYRDIINTWFADKVPGRESFDTEKEPALAKEFGEYKKPLLDEKRQLEFSPVTTEEEVDKMKLVTGDEYEVLLHFGLMEIPEEGEKDDGDE